MLRLLLHSRDLSLRNLLGPAPGSDFRLVVESDDARTRELVSQNACDVLILDTEGFSRASVLGMLEAVRSLVPVVAMAGDTTRALALELVERGVYDWFHGPPVLPELKAIARRAHENATLISPLQPVNKQRRVSDCEGMIGSSARARVVYDMIRRVCGLDASVLVTGETGTGKELIARAIHRLSPRKTSPFVTVSCGAIPENLIEAELFGYEKGAFTGASGKRIGYLEHVGEGTLFLDEIGELSLYTQVKMLRVLQEREFSPLGGSATIPLRARVVFATHRNLPQMVREGTFRQDLFYRVNVIGIESPPLRDRAEDIPALAMYFLNKYAESSGASARGISPGAMAVLLGYSWPGNIRELENAIQRAIIVSDAEEIRPEHLPGTLHPVPSPGVPWDGGTFPGTSFEGQLHAFRIALARKAIHESDGNKTLAAQTLGISRTYLHRLIRQPDGSERGAT